MNKLFSFITKKESHHIIRIAAKVFRVFYIISAFITASYCIIFGAAQASEYGDVGTFIALFLIGVVSFFIIMFIGIFIESMLVGFSNIAENQYEELVLKDKAGDEKYNFALSKKQNAAIEKLSKLNELKNAGVITDEEYEEKKRNYLNDL